MVLQADGRRFGLIVDRVLNTEEVVVKPLTSRFKDIGTYARTLGWPGPPNQKAGLAWSKFIIVDMFARAIQGDSPAAAVAWAETELKSIYEA